MARVSNVTATSFDVRLQNPSDRGVQSEAVSYIVMEEGEWEIDGVKCEAHRYTSTRTDNNGSWVAEQQVYQQAYTNPVVLGQVMSENDPDWSVFWCRGNSRVNPPSATFLYTGKTVCEDWDRTRANEIVGFIVFETGSGTTTGVAFESKLGADTVRGVTDSPPYMYNFATPFSGSPAVVLACMAAMDGNNGGWSLSYGDPPATAAQIRLAIDEDQVRDSERNHTTEQVAYLVFESPVSVGTAGDVNFGYETAFASEERRVDGKQIATQVTLSGPGTLTGISAYVRGSTSKLLRYAMYTDSGGEPGTLIVETANDAVGSSSYHWHTISTAPTALTAGTYWLALSFEHQNMYYKYSTSGGATRYNNNDAVGGGYSASWGSSSDSNSAQVSIYATYTPTSGGAGTGYTIDWRE